MMPSPACTRSLQVRLERSRRTRTTTGEATRMKLVGLLLMLAGSLLVLITKPSQGSQQQQLYQSSSSSSSTSQESGSTPESAAASTAVQSYLLDTTQQSFLGWTRYPDGPPGSARTPGWVEESFFNFERGINWRSFVVCDVAFNSVNNWLWVPFIQRGDANRLYIEIKFTMRDCNLFPQMVLSCKETFALLYKEMDAPISASSSSSSTAAAAVVPTSAGASSVANASFAQTDSYTLIDAIAADEGRFTSNTDVVINTEIRSIPVSKRGVYFAFRDQGACLSLISIKVYHISCPQLVTNFARFNATPTGRDLTSLVAVEGQCVENSVQIEQPRMFCTSDGNWNQMASGQCKCLAGFEPQANNTKCSACPPGRFKHLPGDSQCQLCPERSFAGSPGSSECKCHEGYYRAPKDSKLAPCTQPPSAVENLTATYVDSTSVILQWSAPKFTGNREDLAYKLLCLEGCSGSEPANQQTLLSSPVYYPNFSETKCVLANLQPAQTYKFLIYSMNGVSATAAAKDQHQAQASEISVQTKHQVEPTSSNTLATQTGGFQLMPIYNFRALQGARGSDMVLAWDAQSLQQSLANAEPAAVESSAGQSDTPALYEIRYQARFSDPIGARRSAYPPGLVEQMQGSNTAQPEAASKFHFLTTTNKALVVTNLMPRTEYAFQIRFKWSSGSQWSEFSEPIHKTTTSHMPASSGHLSLGEQPVQDPLTDLAGSNRLLGIPAQPAQSFPKDSAGASGGTLSWLGSIAFGLLLILVIFGLISLTLIHYKKSLLGMQSLGVGGFGSLGSGAGSTYGGVYGDGGPTSGGGAGPFGSPLAAHPLYHNHHPHAHHHHATLSASSAGGLITGSNATSRSSSGASGAGNVVQNFIAATLQQISGHHTTSHARHHQQSLSKQANGTNQLGYTMGGLHHHQLSADGKPLFAIHQQQQHQQHQRNLYQQTLAGVHPHHTLLLGSQGGQFAQQSIIAPGGQALADLHQLPQRQQQSAGDFFKFRAQDQGAANQFQQQGQPTGNPQLDNPQLHIYDDLDVASCNPSSRLEGPPAGSLEIEPQRISIESVIGRGEFGDVCLASLQLANHHQQQLQFATEPGNKEPANKRVAVKTLRPQASERAKLDFLVEASIMSQFNHPNVIQLLGVVTKSEPAMIVTEFMENGSLDSHLRANKSKFTCLQLISMLRGIANGMQYLTRLNYVHKDLAARNILVNEENVCKIADFGLSAHQTSSEQTVADYSANSDSSPASSTNSSANTLSSQATGSTPTTTSTLAGGSRLNQLQSVAEQIAQSRFSGDQPTSNQSQLGLGAPAASIQNPRVPVRWTALEAIAFRRFTSASDVWSYGIVCWEVMTRGERPYWNWSNQDVIKAVEQGYRLPQPENCPEQLYKMMLDCWLKERAARPTFQQILNTLDRLLSPYDDPFRLVQQPNTTRISSQEPAYYDSYNPISQLMSNDKAGPARQTTSELQQPQASVDEWLSSIKMSRYKENFQKHQINSLQYVARLSQADLNLIGIQNGQHLKRILNAIVSLRSASSIGASGEGYLV